MSALRLVKSLSFFTLLVGCQAASPPPSGPPATLASADLPPPAPPPVSASASNEAPPPATSAPAPRVVPPLASDPGRFACGDGSCAAGSETCCAARGEPVACIPNVPLGAGRPGGFEIGPLAPLMMACQSRTQAASFVPLAMCDESADCKGGGVCCAMAVSGDTVATVCMPKAPNGKASCDLFEACAPGGSCARPGAVCVDGACVLGKPKLRCENTSCTGAGEVCCGSPGRCSSEAACQESGGPSLGCRSARDCLAGDRCLVTPVGSSCSSTVIGGVTAEPCSSDAACRGVSNPMCPQGSRCMPMGVGDLNICRCP